VRHAEGNSRAVLVGAIATMDPTLEIRAIFLEPPALDKELVLQTHRPGQGSRASHVGVMVLERRIPSEAERRHVAHRVGV
jgi:hypothetical protein